jgi:hypothetical protein
MGYTEEWADRFVNENFTKSKKPCKAVHPLDIRKEFFGRLQSLVLKPVSYRDVGSQRARACFLMPETLRVHVVSVTAYAGCFHRQETFCIPRISLDLDTYSLPERYDWAWHEVYGAKLSSPETSDNYRPQSRYIARRECGSELTCAIDELPDLALWIFKIMDYNDRGYSNLTLPLGIGDFSPYMWTPKGAAEYELNLAKNKIDGRLILPL